MKNPEEPILIELDFMPDRTPPLPVFVRDKTAVEDVDYFLMDADVCRRDSGKDLQNHKKSIAPHL